MALTAPAMLLKGTFAVTFVAATAVAQTRFEKRFHSPPCEPRRAASLQPPHPHRADPPRRASRVGLASAASGWARALASNQCERPCPRRLVRAARRHDRVTRNRQRDGDGTLHECDRHRVRQRPGRGPRSRASLGRDARPVRRFGRWRARLSGGVADAACQTPRCAKPNYRSDRRRPRRGYHRSRPIRPRHRADAASRRSSRLAWRRADRGMADCDRRGG